MSIATINGIINKDDLGNTYIHEHLSIDLSSQKKDLDTRFDDIESLIKEMKLIKEKGIDTLVEVTNRGMGRNIEVMKKISNEAGIHVVASTGFYKEPFLPSYVYEMEKKELSKLLIKDILEGIDGTNAKAHVIGEIGTSKDTMTPMEHKVFKVAARAHIETGRPFSTHTTLGTYALEQIKFMKENNIDLNKVVIGHLDLNCDLDYHLRIADNGCYLAFDTIGKSNYQSDENRVKHIKELINRGHLNQIVLSQDITRKSHLAVNGGIGYSYLLDNFIPKLLKAGVSKEEIDTMLKQNPKNLLDI
ncbi:phosphotriesterase-related protein [Clostridium sp. D2Q-11]|uniref:Phosphotriesterase-related protein n=1 Tax=Anaeromonas frigoriresistens TaxID=2683708 RepID=A0A942Z951_9FIRM|nr:phosphotriesterase-related protein [Anaeromonas frigoriresistens]MBS4538734.1 phosphotriesterase-related protein [Anaeromonas frigoriresistens]